MHEFSCRNRKYCLHRSLPIFSTTTASFPPAIVMKITEHSIARTECSSNWMKLLGPVWSVMSADSIVNYALIIHIWAAGRSSVKKRHCSRALHCDVYVWRIFETLAVLSIQWPTALYAIADRCSRRTRPFKKPHLMRFFERSRSPRPTMKLLHNLVSRIFPWSKRKTWTINEEKESWGFKIRNARALGLLVSSFLSLRNTATTEPTILSGLQFPPLVQATVNVCWLFDCIVSQELHNYQTCNHYAEPSLLSQVSKFSLHWSSDWLRFIDILCTVSLYSNRKRFFRKWSMKWYQYTSDIIVRNSFATNQNVTHA